ATAGQAAAHPLTMSTDDTFPRRCWDHALDGSPYNIPGTATYDPKKPAQAPDRAPDPRFGPQGDVRYYEGDVATHGLHLLFTGDADNAAMPVPVDEEDATDHQVVLPPNEPNVGAAYSAYATVPVVAVVTPFGLRSAALPQPDLRGPGMPSTPVSGPSGTGSSGTGSSGAGSSPTGPSAPAPGGVSDVPKPLAPLDPSPGPAKVLPGGLP
ncbi:MAG: hypothetical protein ACREOE_04860, partial [Gemmatimonadales bacterium]